jgi:hypothetical protein
MATAAARTRCGHGLSGRCDARPFWLVFESREGSITAGRRAATRSLAGCWIRHVTEKSLETTSNRSRTIQRWTSGCARCTAVRTRWLRLRVPCLASYSRTSSARHPGAVSSSKWRSARAIFNRHEDSRLTAMRQVSRPTLQPPPVGPGRIGAARTPPAEPASEPRQSRSGAGWHPAAGEADQTTVGEVVEDSCCGLPGGADQGGCGERWDHRVGSHVGDRGRHRRTVPGHPSPRPEGRAARPATGDAGSGVVPITSRPALSGSPRVLLLRAPGPGAAGGPGGRGQEDSHLRISFRLRTAAASSTRLRRSGTRNRRGSRPGPGPASGPGDAPSRPHPRGPAPPGAHPSRPAPTAVRLPGRG